MPPKTRTRRCGSGTGSGRSSTPLAIENIALVPPIPNASVRMVVPVSTGRAASARQACRTSRGRCRMPPQAAIRLPKPGAVPEKCLRCGANENRLSDCPPAWDAGRPSARGPERGATTRRSYGTATSTSFDAGPSWPHALTPRTRA